MMVYDIAHHVGVICNIFTDTYILLGRFSSGDLSSEIEDEGEPGTRPPQGYPPQAAQSSAAPVPPTKAGAGPPSTGDLSLNLSQKQNSRTTSAPTSPAKTRESLLQRVQSLTGQAKEQGASIIGKANNVHN